MRTDKCSNIVMVRKGGWEPWVDTVAGFLASRDFSVTGVVLQAGAPDAIARASQGAEVRMVLEREVDTTAGGMTRALGSAAFLRRTLRALSCDVLYLVDSWTLPPVWLATRGRWRWRRARLVYHTFEWLEPGLHPWHAIRLERGACRAADLVVNVERVKARLQQMLYGLPSCPLWVRNALSLHYPTPEPQPECRRGMLGASPPDNAVAVICPSTATPERLTLEQIRAMAKLPGRYRLATIRGPDQYQEQCEREASALGLSDRVVFLPRMPFDRLMEYVASADLGVVIHDGRRSSGNFMASPMRLSQFAACGIPVVASAFPTVEAEVYKHGLGVCCDAYDPGAIAAAIADAVESIPGLEVRRRQIRSAFESHLCFERRGEYLAVALDALLAKSGSHRT